MVRPACSEKQPEAGRYEQGLPERMRKREKQCFTGFALKQYGQTVHLAPPSELFDGLTLSSRLRISLSSSSLTGV